MKNYKVGLKVITIVDGVEKEGIITKVFNKACNVQFKDECRCVRKKELIIK